MTIIALLFLILALITVVSWLWPNWAFTAAPVITPRTLIGLIITLIVLYLVYLVVVALFGPGPPVAR